MYGCDQRTTIRLRHSPDRLAVGPMAWRRRSWWAGSHSKGRHDWRQTVELATLATCRLEEAAGFDSVSPSWYMDELPLCCVYELRRDVLASQRAVGPRLRGVSARYESTYQHRPPQWRSVRCLAAPPKALAWHSVSTFCPTSAWCSSTGCAASVSLSRPFSSLRLGMMPSSITP
ncbi:hypothetical protein GGI35DRAFT_150210 [Trichoderma velutinum]